MDRRRSVLPLTCGRCDGGHLVCLLAGPSPAADGHVLAVGAVGPTPDPVSAVQQGRLRSFTADVVQEDQTGALAVPPVRHHFRSAPGNGQRRHVSFIPVCRTLFVVLCTCSPAVCRPPPRAAGTSGHHTPSPSRRCGRLPLGPPRDCPLPPGAQPRLQPWRQKTTLTSRVLI